MGHHKLFYKDAKFIRDSLNEAVQLSSEIQEMEKALAKKLHFID